LQAMYGHMDEEIEKLTVQVAEQAEHRWGAQLLMTHPGVGHGAGHRRFPGDPQRFADGRALASYTGLIPQVNAVIAEVAFGAGNFTGLATNQDLASHNVPTSLLTQNNFRFARDTGGTSKVAGMDAFSVCPSRLLATRP
jgi:transposase IS116/IS110/IS902 family protein